MGRKSGFYTQPSQGDRGSHSTARPRHPVSSASWRLQNLVLYNSPSSNGGIPSSPLRSDGPGVAPCCGHWWGSTRGTGGTWEGGFPRRQCDVATVRATWVVPTGPGVPTRRGLRMSRWPQIAALPVAGSAGGGDSLGYWNFPHVCDLW